MLLQVVFIPLVRLLGGDALVALLGDGEAHAAAAREGDVRLRALADYEHVVQPATVIIHVIHVIHVTRRLCTFYFYYGINFEIS